MVQLIVRLNSEEKAKMLSEVLSELAFVNSVELTEEKMETTDNEVDFFSLAGLWENRNISVESIRQNAWPERNK